MNEGKPDWEEMPPLPSPKHGEIQIGSDIGNDFTNDNTICNVNSDLENENTSHYIDENSIDSNIVFRPHYEDRSSFKLKSELSSAHHQIEVLKQTIKSMERQLSYIYQSNAKSTRTMENGRSMAQLNKANSDSLQIVLDKDIFPYIKFITKDEIHNIREGSIASRVMSNLGLPEHKWAEYWSNQSSIVWYLFNTERTRFAERVKKQFVKGKVFCNYLK